MKVKLSRKKDYRENLLRNLTTSLILYEEIRTTKAKARAVRPLVEHLISVARKNDLPSRRRLLATLFDKKAVAKIFEIMVPRYKNTASGFVQMINIGRRPGDNSAMVILKLKKAEEVESKEIIKEKNDKESKSKSKPKTAAAPVRKLPEKPKTRPTKS